MFVAAGGTVVVKARYIHNSIKSWRYLPGNACIPGTNGSR